MSNSALGRISVMWAIVRDLVVDFDSVIFA